MACALRGKADPFVGRENRWIQWARTSHEMWRNGRPWVTTWPVARSAPGCAIGFARSWQGLRPQPGPAHTCASITWAERRIGDRIIPSICSLRGKWHVSEGCPCEAHHRLHGLFSGHPVTKRHPGGGLRPPARKNRTRVRGTAAGPFGQGVVQPSWIRQDQ